MPEGHAARIGEAIESGSSQGRLRQWIRWRLNRLSCMTPAEIGHRVRRAISIQHERAANFIERAANFAGRAVPAPQLHATVPWVSLASGVDAAGHLAAADRIVAGRLDLFALHDLPMASPPLWNTDPKTGVQAPLAFGKLLDYRDERRVGNIKYLWELNRHLHLVTLAQAYALSGETKYSAVIRKHLESWFVACPYRMGPNWSSALEAGVRLLNWSVAWQLLGGVDSPLFADVDGERFRRRWLDSVFQHAQFIRGYFSRHSSANNHLIGEASGLFVAASTWPYWPVTRRWSEEAIAILESEALLQNALDGVNREQAMSYQQFVLDLLLLPMLAGRASDRPFSAAFESRLEAMIAFIASMMDAGGRVPMFGDSDDAFAVRFSAAGNFEPYRSLLATGALLFDRPDFQRKAGGLDDKTRWLLGAGAEASWRRLSEVGSLLPVRRAFTDGGYYVLGGDFEGDDEVRLIVDAGALGYQSIAAHGHADALAFVLSLGGREFLIDPGTYAYHGTGVWRAYFRGTAAHNTLRVDGMDQSEPGGNFMWLKKANTVCTRWEPSAELDVFEGWHDGYRRLPDPVNHRRKIVLDKLARRIVIEDRLEMSEAHDIELFFHCSERCAVGPLPDGYRISQGARAIELELPKGRFALMHVYAGSVNPIGGWVSRVFDEKQPCPSIVWRARIAGDCSLRTCIRY